MFLQSVRESSFSACQPPALWYQAGELDRTDKRTANSCLTGTRWSLNTASSTRAQTDPLFLCASCRLGKSCFCSVFEFLIFVWIPVALAAPRTCSYHFEILKGGFMTVFHSLQRHISCSPACRLYLPTCRAHSPATVWSVVSRTIIQ